MSCVLPGKPEPKLQGLATAYWQDRHINAYISGSAIAILDGSHVPTQTIYDEDETPLEAIAIDEYTGRVAVSTALQVRVYRPLDLENQSSKWALQGSFKVPDRCADKAQVISLSWGVSLELLVTNGTLALFTTKDLPCCTWFKSLSSAARTAALSPDSAYIVSVGYHDSLPKVWRRLAFGQDDVRFDMTYLPHPQAVTAIRWRRPFHIDQAVENVLYTICLDCSVRVWTPTDNTDGQHWQLWASVNVGASPRQGIVPYDVRVAFFIDGRDFTASMERAVKDRMADDFSTDDVALDHLVAIANKNPEVCIAIDSRGLMSAWAFENIESATAGSGAVFSIAQVQSSRFKLVGEPHSYAADAFIQAHSYCDKRDGKLRILMHSFDGLISVFTSNVADLLDPTTNDKRFCLETIWSGHSKAVVKINRDHAGRAVVTRTADGEAVVWKHLTHNFGMDRIGLARQSSIALQQVHRVCLLRQGCFVVFLQDSKISLWDTRGNHGQCLAQIDYSVQGMPLCLITLLRHETNNDNSVYIATITSDRHGIVWEVSIPLDSTDARQNSIDISEFCRFKLDTTENLSYVLPVDPAGSRPVLSGFLDIFARDIAISYTSTGRVQFWTARLDYKRRQVEWLSTSCTETSIASPALVSGSMLKKAAVVSSTRSLLTIWDVGGGRLEFEATYEASNTIHDLDWTSTPDSQSILAVGFRHRVILLSQMRFDYLNRGQAWAPIRDINIRDITPHPIGDSTWLGDGYLVVGAGNQLLVYDRQVDAGDPKLAGFDLPRRENGSWDLFRAVQKLNGPLPVFHPQFLSQCMLRGKNLLVRRILMALYKTLLYYVAGEDIDNYLDMDVDQFYLTEDALQSTRAAADFQSNGAGGNSSDDHQLSERTSKLLHEKLSTVGVPQLTAQEQTQLVDIIDCSARVEYHRRSLDDNGVRFMLFYRLHALRKARVGHMHIPWREVSWAFHSTSQDILVDFVRQQYDGAMLWDHARESGIFMWLSDPSSLRAQFEVIARNEYIKCDDRNPTDCSLFYLALGKKAVLQGLWRMANSNREQAATQRLLSNNFDDPRWKTAALKNAYALLSKRRFSYAVAFFLLAGALGDAVDVCLGQLKDLQLAITLCRLQESHTGPGTVLRRVLQDEVLPMASREGDRWLASWAFWLLGRKDMAVRALVMPVFALLETPYSPDYRSRTYLTDDPALVVLYAQLRQQTVQTLRGASKVSPQVEAEFVLQSAKLYDRMGCDLLGLELVRNWEFQKTSSPEFPGDVNPLKLLRRRSSLIIDDRPISHTSISEPAVLVNRDSILPSVFQEPTTSSLLDSFNL